MREWLHRFTGVIIVAVVASALVLGGVILAQVYLGRDIPGTVTIQSTGNLTVTPTTLEWGIINRDDVITELFYLENTSDGPLLIDVADTISSTLTGPETESVLCSVNATGIEGTLAESANITANVTFTVPHDALIGDHTFTLTVKGSTPTE